jgi:hypothetical protein
VQAVVDDHDLAAVDRIDPFQKEIAKNEALQSCSEWRDDMVEDKRLDASLFGEFGSLSRRRMIMLR